MTKRGFTARLLLLCALMLCALLAASASAEAKKDVFNSESGTGSTFLTGEAVKGHFQIFKIAGGKLEVRCEKATVKGTVSANKFESFKVHPLYYNEELKCAYWGEKFSGSTAWVRTQECDYTFENVTDASERADMRIECEGGNTIQLEAAGCKVRIEPQQLHGVKYENENLGKESERAIVADIETEATEGWISEGANCILFGLPENGTTIKGSKWNLLNDFTIKGFIDNNGKEEAQTGIWVE